MLFLLRLCIRYNASPIVLGLFTLPFKDRFPDTKIATHSQSLNWFVFCVLFPVLHCSCLFYFSQPTSCFLLHDSRSCRLVQKFFPPFNLVLEELYPYYKCIHFILFGKIGLNKMINERKIDIFYYYNLPALFSFHYREFSWVDGKTNCNHLGVFHSSSVNLNDKCIYSLAEN